MDGLVEFLRARLMDDERIANEAGGRRAKWRLAVPLDDQELGDAHWLNPPQLMHAERHDPARVLAEVEAKRRVIGRIMSHATVMGVDEVHGDVLRALALPYADHPDYREDWRP